MNFVSYNLGEVSIFYDLVGVLILKMSKSKGLTRSVILDLLGDKSDEDAIKLEPL